RPSAPPEPAGRKVVVQFALFFAYLAIVIPVGFVLSTAAFLMAVTSLYAPKKWIRNLVFSVLFSVAVYVAFVFGLAVYLPVGILG
ncbi:tripartite tricarboxylate transporter TctB family protein, partial [Burkholderia multivorans]